MGGGLRGGKCTELSLPTRLSIPAQCGDAQKVRRPDSRNHCPKGPSFPPPFGGDAAGRSDLSDAFHECTARRAFVAVHGTRWSMWRSRGTEESELRSWCLRSSAFTCWYLAGIRGFTTSLLVGDGRPTASSRRRPRAAQALAYRGRR